jgi:predicted ATPase
VRQTHPTARPYRAFGSWLRSRRLARRWTQEELARQLDYDVTYVRKIEWGQRRASEAFRIRLAQVLSVPVSTLPDPEPAMPTSRLPEAPSPLIGRLEEVAEITGLFENGARLVTLLGAPGIGKTRLSLALAHQFDDELPAGARFVPLVTATDAAGVARAIASVLDLPPRGGSELEQLLAALHAQELFLVLDNFEQVAQAAPLVGELLEATPTLRILATSRQPLDLRRETQYRVPPLALPTGDDDSPERLAGVDAVALFLARARRARPDFELTEANGAAVARICAELQGIPLAIELAAATAPFLAPSALLARLGHGLDLPMPGPRDAPEHQRTLRTAIRGSFELLRPFEHILMRRLAVFSGGFTLDAAEAICVLPHEHAGDAHAGLLALAGRSLLEPVATSSGTARFVALEAVREFALEALAAAHERESFQRRHAEWFLELAEASERRLTGPEQGETLTALETEHGNLRSAIRWSLTQDSRLAVRLCARLWRFWWIRGHLSEGRQWLDEALAVVEDDECAYASALTGAGVLARAQGAYDVAAAFLGRAAARSRETGDRHALALALINLGNVAADQGDPDAAWKMFQESRALYTELGDVRGVGHTLNCLGFSQLGAGDLTEAAALFDQAASIFRGLGDDWSRAMVLANRGWVAYKQQRPGVARAFDEKALTMYRALGDDRGAANTLLNLGLAIQAESGRERATGLFEEALLDFVRLGERRGVAECLEALALDGTMSEPATTARILGAADDLRARLGAPLWPDERVMVAGVVDRLRTDMGEAHFDVSWQEGRMMRLDEVVTAALSGRDPPTRRTV